MLNVEQHHPNTSTTTEMTNYKYFLTDHRPVGNALGLGGPEPHRAALSSRDTETRKLNLSCLVCCLTAAFVFYSSASSYQQRKPT